MDVVALARESLREDGGLPRETSLQLSIISRRKVVRIAYDGTFTYGQKGAHWYNSHHAFAERLSRTLPVTVHAYVFDPDELERMVAYGNGRRVGGMSLLYEDADLPQEEGELNDESFRQLQSKWPLGYLAYVFGLDREELLRLPREPSLLLPLDGVGDPSQVQTLWSGSSKRRASGGSPSGVIGARTRSL